MAEGFDLIYGEAVLKARQTYPHIKLIAVIPFQGQELSYSVEDKRRYKTLYENASERVYTSDTYHKDAFFVRNDYLLAHASVLVCYYIVGKRSGTMYTFNRAVKANLETINLRISLSHYINYDTPEKRELIRYAYLQQLSVEKDGIVIDKGMKSEVKIDYHQIRDVRNESANLCITLHNDMKYKLSTISDDVRIAWPTINPSPFTVIWWRLSGWCGSLFHKE